MNKATVIVPQKPMMLRPEHLRYLDKIADKSTNLEPYLRRQFMNLDKTQSEQIVIYWSWHRKQHQIL